MNALLECLGAFVNTCCMHTNCIVHGQWFLLEQINFGVSALVDLNTKVFPQILTW